MDALLIIDVQNDFCPGGALPAPECNKIIPVINKIINKFSLVLASKDWHPEDTAHFKKWPKHCIKNSWGAEFHPGLKTENIKQVLMKGTGNKDDGYSAFEATNIDVPSFLKSEKVTRIYIAGLTTEYCVKNSALDAVKVIEDAIEGVRQNEGDVEKSIREMKSCGVKFITSDKI
jgi:nicotinamidase/pyrazinamidase